MPNSAPRVPVPRPPGAATARPGSVAPRDRDLFTPSGVASRQQPLLHQACGTHVCEARLQPAGLCGFSSGNRSRALRVLGVTLHRGLHRAWRPLTRSVFQLRQGAAATDQRGRPPTSGDSHHAGRQPLACSRARTSTQALARENLCQHTSQSHKNEALKGLC